LDDVQKLKFCSFQKLVKNLTNETQVFHKIPTTMKQRFWKWYPSFKAVKMPTISTHNSK